MPSHEWTEKIEVLESILGTEVLYYDVEGDELCVHCLVNLQTKNITVFSSVNLGVKDGGGKEEVFGQSLSYLAPVLLSCKPSDRYPEQENLASLSVNCVWLSKDELESVEHHLKSLWTEGEPVIFDMITWIQDNLLEHLNIYDEIHIPDSAEGYCCDARTRISILDQSNKDSTVKLFKTQSHDCCTCFCEFSGEELCLLTCLHPYCVDCIATLIEVQFDSGRYCNMNCSLCDTFVGRDTIEQYMEKAKFPTWEERFLMQSVEEMDMVLFCPRCNGYAVRGEDNLDTCASCKFIFCDRCNNTWHPGECEAFEHGSGAPSDETTGEKGEAKRLKAEAKKNEKLTQLMKVAFLKPCPKCRCWVMRDTGCNHMNCALCKTDFCYKCGKPGGFGCCEYEAVSAPKDIEDLTDLQAVKVGRVNLVQTTWAENIIQYDAEAEEITKCPKCKSKIQRIGGNNHGNCIVCKTQFCFLCLTVMKGTGHFQSSGCRQHGGWVKR